MNLRRIVICAALAAMVLLMFIGWRILRTTEIKSVRLADGRELRVVSATYGKEHRFIDGPLWKRTLASVLPTNLVSSLGVKVLRRQTTSDALVVWIERRNYTNLHPPLAWLSVQDKLGLETVPEYFLTSLSRSNGSAVAGFLLKSFPRRESVIRLRLKENTGPNKITTVAEFEIRNDWGKQPPAWPAEPLPQTRRDGEFEFTLLALNTGLTTTGLLQQMNQMVETWTEAVFRIGTNEPARLGTNFQVLGNWTFGQMTLTDATGNEIFAREPQPHITHQGEKLVWMRKDDGVANLYGAVWPDETWKLRAEFILQRGAELPADQLWTVKDIPLPAPGETIRFNTNAHLFGADVTLASITGNKPGDQGPKLHLQFVPPDIRYELRVVGVSDQRGTNFLGTKNSYARLSERVFELRPPPGAETANVIFGVTRTYAAEFLVRPALVRTNLAHWPVR